MAECVVCRKPLTLFIESEEEDEDEDKAMASSSAPAGSYVDDDVQLECGCHFHWSCLLDAYSMTECSNCGKSLITTSSSGEQQLLCNLKNEGGLQEGLDILPILTEESYLKAYPEERKCRAFLEFCGEGDIEAIVDLLGDRDTEDEEEEPMQQARDRDILRYQDQVGSMGTGLHAAIQNQKLEVAWLLLFLASNLGTDQFPTSVLEAAQNFGLQREDPSSKTDIRSIQDAMGMTAEQRAASIGGVWNEWISTGRLKPPEA